ncbi:MAG: hypothetical protein FJW20_01370 [Acidimicrobiia bacterium]|nr:hypothetical protein [Acidimicrobiia bacterium]
MVWLALAALAVPLFAQTPAVEYAARLDHPRLLLPAKRQRLLERERERESLRWNQLNLLVSGGARMPEPGFAHALFYAASGDMEHGRKAVDWALGPGSDLRQIALVFDWCQPLLSASDSERLIAKLKAGLAKSAGKQTSVVRNRVLAALALAGHMKGVEHTVLKEVMEDWWKEKVLAPLETGRVPFLPEEHYALLELLHAIRDNTDVDLRETAAKHFLTLPVFHILSHYPAPYPAAENEYRVPLMAAHGEPDLRGAVLSRAAALAMVAFDTNSQEMQFLQGWLIQDRYLMNSTVGAPYEFLWANPYQPGLSFHYLPNIFHDPKTGRLIVRSHWEDDAVWFYQAAGQLQLFENGVIRDLKKQPLEHELVMGNTVLRPANMGLRFALETEEAAYYYVTGLKPEARYEIEVDDEGLRELETDRGGLLELRFPAQRKAGVRITESRQKD